MVLPSKNEIFYHAIRVTKVEFILSIITTIAVEKYFRDNNHNFRVQSRRLFYE